MQVIRIRNRGLNTPPLHRNTGKEKGQALQCPAMFYHVFETRDLETVLQLNTVGIQVPPSLTRVVPRLAPSSHLSDGSKCPHRPLRCGHPALLYIGWGPFRVASRARQEDGRDVLLLYTKQ